MPCSALRSYARGTGWADASVSSTVPAAAPTRVPVCATSPPEAPVDSVWTGANPGTAPVGNFCHTAYLAHLRAGTWRDRMRKQ